MKDITAQHLKDIYRCLYRGLTYSQTAKEIGITRAYVAVLMHKYRSSFIPVEKGDSWQDILNTVKKHRGGIMPFQNKKPNARSGGLLPPEKWQNGWIVNKKQRVESPNHSGEFGNVYGIVTHYTACPRVTENNEERITNWLKNKGKASTHFVILRDGTILQGVPITHKAWHAGESSITVGGRVLKSLNNYTIGIDFDNIGPLKKVKQWDKEAGKDASYFTDCFKAKWLYDAVYLPKSKGGEYWEPYTAEQICSYIDLTELLLEHFKIGIYNIWGHSDVSPGRKIDPGGAFPWDFVRGALGDEALETTPSMLMDLQKMTCYKRKLHNGTNLVPLVLRVYDVEDEDDEKEGET